VHLVANRCGGGNAAGELCDYLSCINPEAAIGLQPEHEVEPVSRHSMRGLGEPGSAFGMFWVKLVSAISSRPSTTQEAVIGCAHLATP